MSCCCVVVSVPDSAVVVAVVATSVAVTKDCFAVYHSTNSHDHINLTPKQRGVLPCNFVKLGDLLCITVLFCTSVEDAKTSLYPQASSTCLLLHFWTHFVTGTAQATQVPQGSSTSFT